MKPEQPEPSSVGEHGEPLRRNRFSERGPAPRRGAGRSAPRDASFTIFGMTTPAFRPTWGIGEDGASPTGSRQRHQDPLCTHPHLWPDSRDRTRDAVDSMVGPAYWGGLAR